MISRIHTKRILLIVVVALGVTLFVRGFTYPPGWDFRNNLWAPAHLLVNGESPYYIDELFDSSNAVWLPPIIGLLFPLGWLSLNQASNLWWLISLGAMLAVIWISTGQDRPKPLRLFFVSVLVFLFPSVITHFDLGQVSIFITLIYLVVALYGDRLNGFTMAFLLVLALTKPQLGLFVIPGLFVTYFRENGRQQTLRLIGWMALTAAILTIPFFVASPGWIADLLINLQRNSNWAHASLQSWLSGALGSSGLLIWGLLLVLGMWLNIRYWRDKPRREAAVFSLALTPLLTPYIWSWDFVLVIPLLVGFGFRKQPPWLLALFGLGYLLCIGIIIQLKLSANLSEEYFWWVPWVLVGLVILGDALNKKYSRQ